MNNSLFALYELADREEIEIDEYPMKRHISFSLMDVEDGSCYIAIDPMQLESSQSEKIILAHEIGHCMTGSFYNLYSSFDIRKRHENRADKWSIMQLVPEAELNEAVSAGFTQIWQLAEYFDVPEGYMRRVCHWYKYHNMDCSA